MSSSGEETNSDKPEKDATEKSDEKNDDDTAAAQPPRREKRRAAQKSAALIDSDSSDSGDDRRQRTKRPTKKMARQQGPAADSSDDEPSESAKTKLVCHFSSFDLKIIIDFYHEYNSRHFVNKLILFAGGRVDTVKVGHELRQRRDRGEHASLWLC